MFSHNLFYTFILCNILHNNLENKYFSKIKNYSRKPWKQQAGKSGKLSENYERHGAARYSPRRASPTHIVLSWVKSYYRSYYSSQEHCSWSCFFFKRHLNESECRFINEKWEIIPESGVPTGKQICFFELCIYLCLALFFFSHFKAYLGLCEVCAYHKPEGVSSLQVSHRDWTQIIRLSSKTSHQYPWYTFYTENNLWFSSIFFLKKITVSRELRI